MEGFARTGTAGCDKQVFLMGKMPEKPEILRADVNTNC
jgi:hypothetical protein